MATKAFSGARTLVVNRLGDQVLAGAAFALNKDGGGFAGRDLAHEIQQLGHLGRDANHVVIAGAPVHFSTQGLHFGSQARGLERVLDGDVQFVEVERLADEVVGAQLEGGLHVVELRVGGNHDDGARVPVLLELVQHLQAAQVGHAHVEQHEVGRFMLGDLEARFAGLGLDDVIAPFLTLLFQRPADEALVVHNQDFLGRHSSIAYYGHGDQQFAQAGRYWESMSPGQKPGKRQSF